MSLQYFLKNVFKKLSDDHFRVMRAIEANLRRYEVVPREVIERGSGLGAASVEKLLNRLHSYKLVWMPRGRLRGYALNYMGLDLLALKSLVDRDVVESVGKLLGVGKEADVYEALSPEGKPLAVKFFRIGRTSFRGYERKRSALVTAHTYMLASIQAAAREYQALLKLYPKEVAVPRPVARDRHVVVTEVFKGIEVASAQYIRRPTHILCDILSNLEKAQRAGVVHSDLSVYNILVTPEEKIMIIDWPQWVEPSHPMAREYLRRDVGNLLRFFKRRWNIGALPREYVGLVEKLVGETFNTFIQRVFRKGAP